MEGRVLQQHQRAHAAGTHIVIVLPTNLQTPSCHMIKYILLSDFFYNLNLNKLYNV